MGLNRGKRSLVLDLKQAAAADVFVHSMRPQKIERLGFGHQAVCARGFFRRATHTSKGEILFADQPVRFGDSGAANARLQPRLGEHSIEILREAGISEAAIEALLASGAIAQPERKAQAAE